MQPGTPLRKALTEAASKRAVEIRRSGEEYTPLAEIVSEQTIVNAVVALLATGGSTNHTIHLVAIAAAAGIVLTWDDFSDLAEVVPLLARIYPNGPADINHFAAAGGVPFLIGELLDAGLLHREVRTVAGDGLDRYRQEPRLIDGHLEWQDGTPTSLDEDVLRGVAEPFDADGGLRILKGNLGRAVIKISAVQEQHRAVIAPARIFPTQAAFDTAYRAGELNCDVIVVLRNQGPAANGMPELHGLTPALGSLQDRGHKVALVTDGRMSGASGKIPAAIQLSPEAAIGGPLAKVRDGDIVRLDADRGTLEVLVPNHELEEREAIDGPPSQAAWSGTGRELFGALRAAVTQADEGARTFSVPQPGYAEVEANR